MLSLSINDKEYLVPQEWSEVSLVDFVNLHDIVMAMPKVFKDTIDKMFDIESEEGSDGMSEVDILKWKSECVKHFIPTDDIDSAAVEDITNLFDNHLVKFVIGAYNMPLETFEPSAEFTFKDVEYSCSEMMKDEPYIKYLEVKAARDKPKSLKEYYEEIDWQLKSDEVINGNWVHLPYMVAMLVCDGYDEEWIKKKAKEFEGLPMDIVWCVVFFLWQRNQRYVQGIATSMKEEKRTPKLAK